MASPLFPSIEPPPHRRVGARGLMATLLAMALSTGPSDARGEPEPLPAAPQKAKGSKQRPKEKRAAKEHEEKKHGPGRGPSKVRKSPRRPASEIIAAGRGDGPEKKDSKPVATKVPPPPRRKRGTCPSDMVKVRGQFCVDRYEAYIAHVLPGGKLERHSPFKPVGTATNIKALNRRGRMPQAYISQRQAAMACKNAGKRLCTDQEWITACKGKRPTTWPYGKAWKPGRCNDQGKSHFNELFGKDGKAALQSAYTFENLNDERLNRPPGTCAPSGRFKQCKNSFHVYDMVGNLHEWTANPGGVFRGGYYLDVKQHGDGCDYLTSAHSPKYHDYSTGFRCCADL